MENLQPLRAVKQLEEIKSLGLIGVNIQPAFLASMLMIKSYTPFMQKQKNLI